MMLRVICQKFCATRSGPTYSNFCLGKSAEVTTVLTPGSAAAFEVSIERMRAWAWGERRIRPTSMPGIARSAPYNARPVTFGTPSGRTGRVPTHLNGLAVAVVGKSCTAASPGRQIAPAGPDRRVAGAQMQATACDTARASAARPALLHPAHAIGLHGLGFRSARINRAAKNGQTEVQVFRFPNELCTDHGRAINQMEPGWESTLTGVPKQVYELWHKHFRPRGYKLRAQIVDWPDGMPGDIGMTLSWQ
jgi:hypothetical protein